MAGICLTKPAAVYYEAAEHAANVIKRFNTKEFTANFFSELVIKNFLKAAFVRLIKKNQGLLFSEYQCIIKSCRFII